MASKAKRPRLSAAAVAAARPKAREYMLWDGVLSSFGLRVHPSGAKSFVVQTRVRGRMRKFTLGRFPDMGIMDARKEAAAVLARIWAGEDPAPAQRPKAPVFRDFAARYRENRKGVWKPSSLKTFDIYMRGRLLPAFGRLKLDSINHARVSAWFDAASVDRPGSANRAFDILSAMLKTARKWGELGEHVPDACANIVRNPKKVVARYLDEDELARLGAVLDSRADEHPWRVAALRLLTLTGARLSEVLNLRWDEIGVLSEDGAERVFPEDLTSHRLYKFWCVVREEAGLPGLRIHDYRHTWASQGVRNGVGLPTVGRLLGHRRLATTAIYAHLDDSALQAAAEKAAGRIAKAMGFEAETSPEKSDNAQMRTNPIGLP